MGIKSWFFPEHTTKKTVEIVELRGFEGDIYFVVREYSRAHGFLDLYIYSNDDFRKLYGRYFPEKSHDEFLFYCSYFSLSGGTRFRTRDEAENAFRKHEQFKIKKHRDKYPLILSREKLTPFKARDIEGLSNG